MRIPALAMSERISLINRPDAISSLWVLTFFSAIAGDVMFGMIRYYTSILGVPQIAYLPKVMMLICVIIIIVRRPNVYHFLSALYLAVEACVSLSNGASLAAVGFWMWLILPLIFTVLAPRQSLEILEEPRAWIAFLSLTALCMVGVFVNYFYPLPWIGKSLDIGGFDVQAAAASYVGTVQRLPGFGRDSAATGLMIGTLIIWVLPRLRSYAVASIMLAAAALAIWATTNKTTLISLVVLLAIWQLGSSGAIKKACMWVLALTTVLPFAGLVATEAINHIVVGTGLLASMQDRFVNTWPLLLNAMLRENLIGLGIGPGGFGSLTGHYQSAFGFNVGYSDNMVLYLVANFGIIGGILFMLLMAQFVFSSRREDKRVWLMLLFLLLSGITTDIYESIGCLLFLGVTIKSIATGATFGVAGGTRTRLENVR
ncbi:hypothetical protein [Paraburkholderia bryophila]|uniref:O-antigen ligase-like membrane protein n=2 Tax=Paraburkholderia TaxID=1822464 RepID=A0A7Y9WTJ6_9BURK|nr:hypothetical protein [Paraburkholderia bryophila]NYH25846.1 hypothetical protein [Paraburkholderia bryophila]